MLYGVPAAVLPRLVPHGSRKHAGCGPRLSSQRNISMAEPKIVVNRTPFVLEGPNSLLFEVKDFLKYVGNPTLGSSDSGANFDDVTADIQTGSGSTQYLVVTANVSYPSYYSSAGDIVIIIDTYDDPNYPQRITKTFGTLRQKITYLREAIEKPKAKGSRSLAKKKSATDGKKKSATDGK
jgi:hypothetical protein